LQAAAAAAAVPRAAVVLEDIARQYLVKALAVEIAPSPDYS
jgi:hypothetical protein